MTFGFSLSLLFFLYLLFNYQRSGKIYIGYTTVLTLLFFSVFLVSLISDSRDLIVTMIFFIMGSLVIYLTSQLTLAFSKIQELSQNVAIMKLKQEQENSNKEHA